MFEQNFEAPREPVTFDLNPSITSELAREHENHYSNLSWEEFVEMVLATGIVQIQATRMRQEAINDPSHRARRSQARADRAANVGQVRSGHGRIPEHGR